LDAEVEALVADEAAFVSEVAALVSLVAASLAEELALVSEVLALDSEVAALLALVAALDAEVAASFLYWLASCTNSVTSFMVASVLASPEPPEPLYILKASLLNILYICV